MSTTSKRPFRDRGFPEILPTSWYQVEWSGALKPGDTQAVRYFDRDLVLFREEEGEVHLLDAHCLHLGAHLGVGGKVKGSEIECPFHGWRWDGDGKNNSIPYSEQTCAKKLGRWSTAEHSGLIYAWFDHLGRPPMWEAPSPIAEATSPQYFDLHPAGTSIWKDVAVHPQSPTENIVDPVHLMYVHGAGAFDLKLATKTIDHRFQKVTNASFGVGKESTILTPDGPCKGVIKTEAWGLGYFVSHFDINDSGTSDMVLVTATTPVDHHRSDLRQTIIPLKDERSNKEWSKLAAWWVRQEAEQAEADLLIWENMRQISKAPFTREERSQFQALRKWAAQFYTDDNPNEAIGA